MRIAHNEFELAAQQFAIAKHGAVADRGLCLEPEKTRSQRTADHGAPFLLQIRSLLRDALLGVLLLFSKHFYTEDKYPYHKWN